MGRSPCDREVLSRRWPLTRVGKSARAAARGPCLRQRPPVSWLHCPSEHAAILMAVALGSMWKYFLAGYSREAKGKSQEKLGLLLAAGSPDALGQANNRRLRRPATQRSAGC